MINQDKIKIYRKYHGDIDSWARNASKKERKTISSEEWYVIDSLVQDLSLINSGLTSMDYNIKINEKLRQLCYDENVISELKKLS